MWSLLLAVIFFASAGLLGKLFNIESLYQISRIAFCGSALALLITNPFKPFWWMYRARPLSSLPKDERQALV